MIFDIHYHSTEIYWISGYALFTLNWKFGKAALKLFNKIKIKNVLKRKNIYVFEGIIICFEIFLPESYILNYSESIDMHIENNCKIIGVR